MFNYHFFCLLPEAVPHRTAFKSGLVKGLANSLKIEQWDLYGPDASANIYLLVL